MNISTKHGMALAAALAAAVSAQAELMDRPEGIRIGQRLTIKPYVAFSATYDSNVGGNKDAEDDVILTVNPGFTLDYTAESWYLKGTGNYSYNGYLRGGHANEYSYHNYGESVLFGWNSAPKSEKGWSLMLNQSFILMNSLNDVTLSDGSSYGRDTREFRFGGSLEHRFTERLHADVSASYCWLDYDNSSQKNSLYGWSRWLVGGEIGYAASKWFDILVSANYSNYRQDNSSNSYYDLSGYGSNLSNDSESWSLMAGFGSFATDRISYRLLVGWNHFEYAGRRSTTDAMTYSASGRWLIGETWNMMLLATCHYQPSEREYGSSQRTDSLSWGIAKSLVRGKANATFDICYRHEGHDYSMLNTQNYDLDTLTFRLGLNYTLNRYLALFGRAEYRRSFDDGKGKSSADYDYDRFRASLGFRLTY